MKKKILAVLSLSLVPLFGHAAGDPEAGKTKAPICTSCHGADGKMTMMPSYPKLAGQNAAYLEMAIKAYKNGERTGPQAMIMKGMASPLSDQDIADLAAYFSAME